MDRLNRNLMLLAFAYQFYQQHGPGFDLVLEDDPDTVAEPILLPATEPEVVPVFEPEPVPAVSTGPPIRLRLLMAANRMISIGLF